MTVSAVLGRGSIGGTGVAGCVDRISRGRRLAASSRGSARHGGDLAAHCLRGRRRHPRGRRQRDRRGGRGRLRARRRRTVLRQYRRRRVHDRSTSPAGATPLSISARPRRRQRPPGCISTPPASLYPSLSRYGWRAAGVPGTVMGLDRALNEYGSLPRAAVMAPAIALARDGFVLSRDDAELLDAKADRFCPRPGGSQDFSAARRRPGSSPATVSCKKISRNARGDRKKGAGRILQGTRRSCRRQGEPGQWRNPDRARFCRLHGERGAAALLLLPLLCDRVGAAAEFGRRHDLPNPDRSSKATT